MDQFLLSLIVGIFVGGVAGYLGTLMVSKRMALVGDALGHVALPGMGLALMASIDISIGAFIFLLLGIGLIWFFEKKTSLPMEAVVGVVFVSSLALGFIIIPQIELVESLVGDISKISLAMTGITVLLSILVFIVLKKIYPKIVLANVSEEMAKVEGINVGKLNFIYLLLIAIVIAIGIKVTGSLLVGALLIVPAVASRNFSRNLKQYIYGSIIIGVLSCVIGILVSHLTDIPAGPLIILVSGLFFLISLIKKK